MRFNGNANAKLRMRVCVCEMKSEWLMLISWLCVARALDGYGAHEPCVFVGFGPNMNFYTRARAIHALTHRLWMHA